MFGIHAAASMAKGQWSRVQCQQYTVCEVQRWAQSYLWPEGYGLAGECQVSKPSAQKMKRSLQQDLDSATSAPSIAMLAWMGLLQAKTLFRKRQLPDPKDMQAVLGSECKGRGRQPGLPVRTVPAMSHHPAASQSSLSSHGSPRSQSAHQ